MIPSQSVILQHQELARAKKKITTIFILSTFWPKQSHYFWKHPPLSQHLLLSSFRKSPRWGTACKFSSRRITRQKFCSTRRGLLAYNLSTSDFVDGMMTVFTSYTSQSGWANVESLVRIWACSKQLLYYSLSCCDSYEITNLGLKLISSKEWATKKHRKR